MDNEKVSRDYEARCKELERIIAQQSEEINHEWQNKFEKEAERTSEIIDKLKLENKFYKNIIKSILHI